jgi:hypothetical protein
MEKSKASWVLRQALKRRTRRWRRRQVVGFYLFMLFTLLISLGADHHGRGHFWFVLYPLVTAISTLSWWGRSQQRTVTSLDDRAQAEHGMNFEQLTDSEQKSILRRYRMGRYILDWTTDERQETSRLRANETAFRILRVALFWFAVCSWVIYFWMPSGDWRDMLMDSPVLISWLGMFVVSLPQAIVMWTEPDEVGEPRLV